MTSAIEPFLVRIACSRDALDLPSSEARNRDEVWPPMAENPSLTFRGSGFRIAPGAIVTCRHVVRPRDSADKECQPVIWIAAPGEPFVEVGRAALPSRKLPGTSSEPCIIVDDENDLAIIRSPEPLTGRESAHLCRGVPRRSRWALEQCTLRAPAFAGSEGTPNESAGFDLMATFDDAVGQRRVQIKAGLDAGMSGGPVLLEPRASTADPGGPSSYVLGVLYLGGERVANSSWVSVDRLLAFLSRHRISPANPVASADCVLVADLLAAIDDLGDLEQEPMATFRARRHGFTGREWLFGRVRRWLGAKTPQGLRIEAAPGLGKTAFASELAHRITTPGPDREGCWPVSMALQHVCDSLENSESTKTAPFVRNVAAQLARRSEYFARACMDQNHALLSRLMKATHSQPKSVWKTVLETIARDPSRPRPLLLVDGLEHAIEDPAETGDSILTLLDGANGGGQADDPPLRVLVTSQPNQRIDKTLKRYDVERIHPTDECHRSDLKAYLTSRLPSHPTTADRLSDAAAGNFYFAKLVIDELAEIGHSQDEGLAAAVSAWLNDEAGVPRGLDELYARMFDRRFERPDTSHWRAARTILALLLVASAPLPKALLHAAVTDLDYGEVESSLVSLGAFVSERESCLAIYHDSLRRWLRSTVHAGGYTVAPGAELDAHSRLCDAIDRLESAAPTGTSDEATRQFVERHYSTHLAASGRIGRLRALLANARWLRGRLAATGAGKPANVAAVVREYTRFLERNSESDGGAPLERIRDALSLSESVLRRHPEQLASQLIGRLAGDATPEIASLLDGLRHSETKPWLRPLVASLIRPDDPVSPGRSRLDRAITAIVTTIDRDNQPLVVAGGFDGRVCVRRWGSWRAPVVVATHPGGASALAVCGDAIERRGTELSILSAGYDGVVRRWRLAGLNGPADTTLELRACGGHIRALTCLTDPATPARSLIVVCSDDCGGVWLWSEADRVAPRLIGRHGAWVNALAPLSSGSVGGSTACLVAAADADGGISLWSCDASTSSERSTPLVLREHGAAIRALFCASYSVRGPNHRQALIAVDCKGGAFVWPLDGILDPSSSPIQVQVTDQILIAAAAAVGADGRTCVASIDQSGLVQASTCDAALSHSVGFFTDAVARQVAVVALSAGDDGASGMVVIVGDHEGELHRLSVEPGSSPARLAPARRQVPPPRRR